MRIKAGEITNNSVHSYIAAWCKAVLLLSDISFKPQDLNQYVFTHTGV